MGGGGQPKKKSFHLIFFSTPPPNGSSSTIRLESNARVQEGLDEDQKNEYLEAFAVHDEKNHGRLDAKKLQEVPYSCHYFYFIDPLYYSITVDEISR